MFIKDATNQQIGEVLVKVCELADLDPPLKPSLVVDFIRKYFGVYELELIDKALQQWVLGAIIVKSPQRLNAQFVSTIVYRAIKDDLVGKVLKWKKPEKPYVPDVKPLTYEDKLNTYNQNLKNWKRYEEDGILTIMLIFMEIQYDFIFENFDKMQFGAQERIELKLELIEAAEKQRQKKLKESSTKLNIKNIFEKQVDYNKYDWNKITCVGLYYRKLCAE